MGMHIGNNLPGCLPEHVTCVDTADEARDVLREDFERCSEAAECEDGTGECGQCRNCRVAARYRQAARDLDDADITRGWARDVDEEHRVVCWCIELHQCQGDCEQD